jgi:hypothetical protein
MRYLSKQFTISIRTLGTMPSIPCSNPWLYDANNHEPNHTLGTFPNNPQSHFVHEVPFQAIHIPNPHTGYWPKPKPYSGHLSKQFTIPIRTQGTFPSRPHSQFVRRVPSIAYSVLRAPLQTNHHPNLYMRYLAKLSTFPICTPRNMPKHYRSTHIS